MRQIAEFSGCQHLNMSSVISVENLSKRYIIGHQRDSSGWAAACLEDAFAILSNGSVDWKKRVDCHSRGILGAQGRFL